MSPNDHDCHLTNDHSHITSPISSNRVPFPAVTLPRDEHSARGCQAVQGRTQYMVIQVSEASKEPGVSHGLHQARGAEAGRVSGCRPCLPSHYWVNGACHYGFGSKGSRRVTPEVFDKMLRVYTGDADTQPIIKHYCITVVWGSGKESVREHLASTGSTVSSDALRSSTSCKRDFIN